jgi:hypothetical protein
MELINFSSEYLIFTGPFQVLKCEMAVHLGAEVSCRALTLVDERLHPLCDYWEFIVNSWQIAHLLNMLRTLCYCP